MTYFIVAIFLIVIGCFFYRGYKNTHSVVINDIKVEEDPQIDKNTPLRILHISDMHIENISITPEALYKELKGKAIDIIAITGDFLDRKRSIPRLVPYLETLNKLNPVYGSYAVFGNHDYVLRNPNFTRLKELLNEYGFKTMQNENERIIVDGKSFNIIGIDDFSTNRSNLIKSYEGLEEGYNLVLTHDPNIVLEMSGYHFDYLLSGHFHGGQIYWPKPYHLVKMGKLVRMNMVKGLQEYNGRQFYISEGLGQTGVNIRIGSRPEITFHNLQLSPEQNNKLAINDTNIAG
ncbi:metallophosphoesterase [Oceanobacillus sp. 143]|uniref:Metallophosphoesterase n=1 Tax=Oceanobacillus zhaokaii TaxID=2052660 RepID=A0A345PFT7_9BACI|nr:metallophosphoesterase [Oceanobacillus zhaokaii]AXI08867.1 metallophosphoesterase [Oceanobacillus zhaokaii]QGS68548.1 metallophosphoesterase [Oceanobacillus sp. 143]